jgi:hypothetical protein
MLPWVVNYRSHPRRTALQLRSSSHSHSGFHPPAFGKNHPFLFFHLQEPILQSLCFQFHTWNGVGVPLHAFSRQLRPASAQNAKFTVVDPHSLQQFTKCSSRNSFVLYAFHFDGGVYPPQPNSRAARLGRRALQWPRRARSTQSYSLRDCSAVSCKMTN